jgi:hypothetical protein
MWLPKPVYKSLPVVYAVMGVLFIAGAIYIDIRDPMGPLYLGLGIVLILASITVAYFRARFPGSGKKSGSDSSKAD